MSRSGGQCGHLLVNRLREMVTVIDRDKLRNYCLNSRHPRGQHKARVFVVAPGIESREAPWLRVAELSESEIQQLIKETVAETALAMETGRAETEPRIGLACRAGWQGYGFSEKVLFVRTASFRQIENMPPFQLHPQLFLAGQNQPVFGREDLLAFL
jgi:hypothetical protein